MRRLQIQIDRDGTDHHIRCDGEEIEGCKEAKIEAGAHTWGTITLVFHLRDVDVTLVEPEEVHEA